MSSCYFRTSRKQYFAPIIEETPGYTATLLPVGRYTDRVAAQMVNPDGPLDYDFSYTGQQETHDGDFYYVRVKQLDGDMAWSSPWWVGGIPPR